MVRQSAVVCGLLVVLGVGPTWASDQFADGPDHAADWRGHLAETYGLEVGLGITSIFQGTTRTIDKQPTLWSFSYDFEGQWTRIDHEHLGRGSLGWLLEGGRVIAHRRDEDLLANVGSTLGINEDLDDNAVALTELWWTHAWLDDALIMTLGKIDQTNYLDTNRIANDETEQFIASALVNNPAVGFPDNGLGANLTIRPAQSWYVSLGGGDARARATASGFNTLGHGDLFGGIEFGLTPDFAHANPDEPLDGAYRLLLWASEVEDDDGWGVALSFDQHLGGGWVPFFRFGYARGDVADLCRFVSAGLGLEDPLGRENDLLAIGWAWGKPADRSLRSESMIELFYRAQLTDWLALTPHAQVVFDPAEGKSGPVGVFGLRLQASF